jgi:hypothetical protein
MGRGEGLQADERLCLYVRRQTADDLSAEPPKEARHRAVTRLPRAARRSRSKAVLSRVPRSKCRPSPQAATAPGALPLRLSQPQLQQRAAQLKAVAVRAQRARCHGRLGHRSASAMSASSATASFAGCSVPPCRPSILRSATSAYQRALRPYLCLNMSLTCRRTCLSIQRGRS